MEVIHKIGRRKTAVARIYMKEGSGKITINKRDLANYFTTPTLQYKVKQPFALLGLEDAYDLNINVYGGGITGQAEAIRLPILKTLILYSTFIYCRISLLHKEVSLASKYNGLKILNHHLLLNHTERKLLKKWQIQ